MLESRLQVTVDGVVTLTFTVTNTGTSPVVLEFDRAQQYDFEVLPRAGGDPGWRWSDEQMFAEMQTERTLAPGARWVITERWEGAPRDASLSARAFLTSSTHEAEARAEFTPGTR